MRFISAIPFSLALLASPCSSYLVQNPETKSLASSGTSHQPSLKKNNAATTFTSTNDRTTVGDLTVPSIGIGTIAWSSNSFASLENEDLGKCVDLACRSNAAFLDTAERYGSHFRTMFGLGYGETEKLTEKFLANAIETQGEPDLKPVVATKFTPVPWRTNAQSVVEACEASCKNLGVDQIDLYQIHMPDIVRPFKSFGLNPAKDELYWDGLAECYHRGLVKNVGVCNYGPTLVARCQEHLAKLGVPLASNQIGYSLLGRHNGAQETLDKCNELGVKVLAYYPFAMGLLTGKYSSEALDRVAAGEEEKKTKDSSSSLLTFKRSSLELRDLERYAKGDGGETIPEGGITPLLRTMETIADNRGKTVAQVALNYVISKGAIPIPGCRTADQLQDNIGSMGWRLTETEIEMLELDADALGFGFDGAGFKRTSEKFVGYGVEKFSLE
jgi:pyridoxine 4-dehydrogenase